MEKKYYKCRDNSYYTKYTKDEIINTIDINDFSTIKPFLKEMDYYACETIYLKRLEFGLKNKFSSKKILGGFIGVMRLPAFRVLGYNDYVER